MYTGKLKGPEKMFQMRGKRKLLEHKSEVLLHT
jgi:hypothetical protein